MYLVQKSLNYSLIIINIFLSVNCLSQQTDAVFIGDVKKGKAIVASCYSINESKYKLQFNDVLHENKEVSFFVDNNEFQELYDDILIGLVQKPQFDIIKKYEGGTLTIHFSKSNFQFIWYCNKLLSVSPFINKKKLILFLGENE
ncbi:MAG: hypothetical protein P8L23_05135 [Flavobacteriales bacterium]|nr:hypothetical protein [Flavobacteriales bacterium]